MAAASHNNGNEKQNSYKVSISESLVENLDKLKEVFSYPLNAGFSIREIYIKSLDTTGALVFMNGMIDKVRMEDFIIKPLINRIFDRDVDDKLLSVVRDVLSLKGPKRLKDFNEIVNDIVSGCVILFIEDYPEALSIDITFYEHRGVEKPFSENVIKGPKEAFTEGGQINRSLIRKQIRNARLITEIIPVGERDRNNIYLMYIKDIASSELVEEVRKRIKDIKSDSITYTPVLEQYIEERPYSLVPTVLGTERPDRACSFLLEGHVVALMDSSPDCLIVPATFWSFFSVTADYYERWAYGNFIRLIRLASIFVALLTPAFYISVANFHLEMIPTDLLLAIAATREIVPFPTIVEILVMEVSFELVREAGIRVPTPIGPTIGIVGALILGQAAVQANIVSPILVIVVSITGLSSFVIPDISFNYMVRIARFIFMLAASVLGFYGIAALLTITIAYLASIKSFGVPFLAPMAPHYPSSMDKLIRSPLWKMMLRPFNMHPQDKIRQKEHKGGNKNE